MDKRYVETSADKIYSPQLASFGPDCSLAYDLYKLGRTKSVIRYFEEAKRFWQSGVENGAIEKAISNIKNKRSDENIYLEEDGSDFPFTRVEYTADYKKSPME